MNAVNLQRPQWPIDQLLDRLTGENVRVAAEAFSPSRWNGELPRRFVSRRDLILPDNSEARGLPLYFEGRLRRFTREIGVVFVELESPGPVTEALEGTVNFRGKIAVILRGPVVVQLSFPFQVEKLPTEAANYWADLQLPRAQFQLPL